MTCECGHKKHEHRPSGRCIQTVKAINGMDWCGCRMYRKAEARDPRGEGV